MGKFLASTIQTWYTKVNDLITRCGGGNFTKLTAPDVGTKIQASHINAIGNKLNELKNDSYLSTETALYSDYVVVSTGQVVKQTVPTNFDTISSNLDLLVCRNTATNSYGTNTQGTHSHGTKSNGSHSHGTHGNGCSQSSNSRGRHTYNNRTNSECCGNGCSESTNSHGTKGNVAYSHLLHGNVACPQGVCAHTTVIDMRNTHTTKSNT